MGIRSPLRRSLPVWGGVLFFSLLFFLPIGLFFVSTLSEAAADTDGGLPALVGDVVSDPATWRVVSFSVEQAAVSALVSVLLALPGAWVLSHVDFPLRGLLRSLSLLPFVLPSIVVVLAMISFFGRNGLINAILGTQATLVYSVPGIILAHVFYNFSLAMRVIGDRWERIDARLIESAEGLGDSRPGTFIRVTLPLLAPAILAGFALVFIYSFLSFGIVLVFGGIRHATLEVQIYRELFVNLRLGRAAVLAILQVILLGGFFLVTNRWITGSVVGGRGAGPRNARRLSSFAPGVRVFVVVSTAILLTFVIGPLVAMFIRGLSRDGVPSLLAFRALFDEAASPRDIEGIVRSSIPGVIARSVGLALAAGTITLVVAVSVAVARRGRPGRAIDGFFLLPLGISVVTAAIALRSVYGEVVSPVFVVVLAQVFIAFPTTYRIARTVLGGLSPSMVETAAALGAGPFTTLRTVIVPVLRPGLVNAYVYALALPFADLTAVLTVGRGEVATFPVAIYRLIGFRSFDLGLALGIIYVLICLGIFGILDATSRRRVAGRPQ